jgi:UDP-N-acetylmuramoyl-tripeptide--D-alanyl-D-alanine ligase
MKIEDLYSLYLKHPNVSIDSRAVCSDSIFFALKGANFNGNAYAYQALENGASYTVIDDKDYLHDDRYILVDDVLKTLQQLANYHRKNINIPIIGITGTNGKTTTKELINVVLSKKYNVCCTKGNFNNHIGVPLTLLQINNQHQIAIVEMGANHVNEIGELCQIAMPNYGVITNIGKAHLEGFGSFENIIKTKLELYDFVRSVQGTVFVNGNDGLLLENAKSIKHIKYGFADDCDIIGKMSANSFFASGVVSDGNDNVEVSSNMFGEYNFLNILAAASLGHYFDVDLNNIAEAIQEYSPSNNRSQIVKTENNELILDAYNANPTSMGFAVEHFTSIECDNKALILGEMYELGENSLSEHKLILDKLVHNRTNKLILLVGNWGTSNVCADNVFLFANVETLNEWLKTNILKNYTILIKGSRSVKLEKCVEYL